MPVEPNEPQTRSGTKWPESPPRPEPLLETIRKLAKARCITYLDHAEERFPERGFDVFDVFDVLENGCIESRIRAGKKEGEWVVKVVGSLEGTSRRMGVVTIVVKEQRLFIKTIEWEDR